MRSLLFSFTIFMTFVSCVHSQVKKTNPFQRVSVPDSIVLKLEEAYSKNAENVNAGKNVFNLINRKDFVFKDGIYSFQGQGPHFPKRVFIYNKDKLFIFENEGAFNPKGIIQEFSKSIETLDLTNQQVIRYAEILVKYLEQELGNTYGMEIGS